MARIHTLLLAALVAGPAAAQAGRTSGHVSEQITALRASGRTFTAVPLLRAMPAAAAVPQAWKADLNRASVLRLDPAQNARLIAQRPQLLQLDLPSEEGTVTLDLERVDITTDDFSVVAASTNAPMAYTAGVHYRGTVRGEAGSVAAISVFGDQVMGLIADDQGDRVLGRVPSEGPDAHILYRTSEMKQRTAPHCDTPDDGDPYTREQLTLQPGARAAKCVRFYWEVNYDIFQNKGSVANATNYVTGLFNQSATLYANDGISVALSQVYVWDVASPYTSTSTSTLLTQFGTTRTSFNGDLANLLGYAGGGGIAWISGLCNSQAKYKMAYSGISSSYSSVPTYSWSVEVVTHEQGHLLGSKHTHACAWNGNNTAIDGCGNAAGYSEGTCAAGPIPTSAVGGTIMSYCHLVSAGIKFANGFGPQPLAVIQNSINNASCLTECAGATCGTPTGLAASSINTTGATLGWTAVSGATSYTLQWKAASASTWTTVSGLTAASYALSGLSAGTGYNFQVLAVCASGSSAYATAVTFTTTAACGVPSGLASSSITTTSATVSWSAVSGASSYTLQWKLASSSTWTTVTGITTTSRSLTGLTAGTAYNFQVLTVCSSGSSAYSSAASFTTTAACGVPTGLNASNLITDGATLNWTAVSGATSYTLQWKLASSSTWTTATGITATAYGLGMLTPGTSYMFQVLSVCASGSSAYASPVTFSTASLPCSVPTGLNASNLITNGATLNWTAVSAATSYTVQWKLASASTWTTVTGITATAYGLGMLTPGTSYMFQVLSVCASGSSAYASPVTFSTAASCGVPASLSSSSITTTSATVNWGAVSGASSYTLQWKLASSSTWTTVTGITTTSRSLTGLTAGTAYNFQVLTVCASGSSAYSNAASFTTTAACGVPSGLASSSITTTSATVNWSAVSGASSYTLQWKLASASTWTTVTGITTTSRSLTGLTAGTAYNFQVLTVCSSGSSAYSSAASFTTTAACGVPSGLASSSITTTSATVSWSAVSGASSYTLQWKLASASTWTTVTGIATTSRSLTGLTAGASYNFQVLTVCSSGSSAYSSAASFATTAACGVPSGLASSSITTTSATVSWSAVSGASSYTLQWKLASASTWTTVTGITTTSRSLTGLSAGTSYNFQVLTVCASGSSAYSSAASFTTTTAGCSDPYEPNNATGNATVIGVNGSINALIGTSTDKDWYQFANTSAAPNIRISLTGLAADYDLRLYRGSTLVASSQNYNAEDELIVYNTSTVASNYKIRVIGYNGAYSTTRCYTLTVEIGSGSFAAMAASTLNVKPDLDEVEGLDGVVAPTIQVYPNPARDQVSVTVPGSTEPTTLELLDGLGRVVTGFTQGANTGNTTVQLDVIGHPDGVYLLRVVQGSANSIQRVVVAH